MNRNFKEERWQRERERERERERNREKGSEENGTEPKWGEKAGTVRREVIKGIKKDKIFPTNNNNK